MRDKTSATKLDLLIIGAGSVLDINPEPVRGMRFRDLIPRESVYESLKSDWDHIALDFNRAFNDQVKKTEEVR